MSRWPEESAIGTHGGRLLEVFGRCECDVDCDAFRVCYFGGDQGRPWALNYREIVPLTDLARDLLALAPPSKRQG